VTHFLLQTVWNFCRNRNLSTDHVTLWVHLCFETKFQAKIEFYINEIIKKNTALDAHDFLIALAEKIDNYRGQISPEVGKLRPGEGIFDYILRLKIELIGIRKKDGEIPKLILELMLKYIKEPAACEIRRTFVPMLNNTITLDDILKQATSLDSILNLGNVGKTEEENITRISSATAKTQSLKSSKQATCAECGDSHNEFISSERPYRHCRNCAFKILLDDNRLKQIRYDRYTHKPTFWSEQFDKWINYPETFLQAKGPNFVPFGRKGTKHKYPARLIVRPPYSIKASDNSRNYQKNFPQWQRSAQAPPIRIKQWSDIAKDTRPPKRYENVTKTSRPQADKAAAEAKISSVDTKLQLRQIDFSRSGRLLVDVFKNQQKSNALIDGGATDDIMSIDFVRAANLLEQMKPSSATVLAFDGSKSRTLGSVKCSIKVGDLQYFSTFKIVKNCDYDVILSANFLGKFGILQKLKQNLRKNFGQKFIHEEAL